ncbi:sensor histidine kinase [Rhizobium sp. TRM95796]|uniref:sensor histidine kinase n=1 Tax=Rhizobium sp. TRM95796 TaxID=2979862 RepID=UPI0021E77A90|nr:HAMP domain-containing sensor histidine kinase [Rhizobium sp. TRM95796]MCV3766632.1 HAMP domain-containing histidine kinase [Rhizobium sp. TRM95796]
MGRTFWHSFLTIWLTMAGAIAIIAAANAYLRVLPPKDSFIDSREFYTMEALNAYLRRDQIDEARAYTAMLARLTPPIRARVTPGPLGGPQDCKTWADHPFFNGGQSDKPLSTADEIDAPPHPPIRPDKDGVVRLDARGERACYHIEIQKERLSYFDRYAPAVLPIIAGLMASVISSFLLASYLVAPIMKLRGGLKTLAGGDFRVRIGRQLGRRRDELATLGKDFDVTAAKLEEMDAAQKRLFHDVSHELRSPLSRLQAAVGLLRKNPARLEALLPRMEREIKRQDGLVEEILTLARLGPNAAASLERETIDVIDLVAAIIDDAAFEAQAKSVGMDYAGAQSFVTRVNGELIYRAIENVARNAVKYSPPGSRIRISSSLGSGGETLDLAIRNPGPVVPQEDIEKIFHPFTRLQESESGYGLGLAITRRAVEAHGGSVEALANPEGGLTVTIVIPRLD